MSVLSFTALFFLNPQNSVAISKLILFTQLIAIDKCQGQNILQFQFASQMINKLKYTLTLTI